jgi:hypothetical protein
MPLKMEMRGVVGGAGIGGGRVGRRVSDLRDSSEWRG